MPEGRRLLRTTAGGPRLLPASSWTLLLLLAVFLTPSFRVTEPGDRGAFMVAADNTSSCAPTFFSVRIEELEERNVTIPVNETEFTTVLQNFTVYSYHCIACPAGHYCPGGLVDSEAITIPCAAGSTSDMGQAAEAADCHDCAPGSYSGAAGSAVCTQCEPGSYADAYGATSCSTCPEGTYCPHGSYAPLPCTGGYYSEDGAEVCTPCEPGYACLSSGASDRIECSAGSFAPGLSEFCRACPAGHRCPSDGLEQPIACDAGTFAVGSATECTPCPAGSVCPYTYLSVTVTCADGFYAVEGTAALPDTDPNAASRCQPCPAGKACVTSSAVSNAAACGPGTFTTTAEGVRDDGALSSGCYVCPAGHFCPFTDQAVVIPCPAGTYADSALGQTACTACPAGFRCPNPRDGSVRFSCPAGTYSAGSQAECTPCPAGFRCPDATAASMVECGDGTYSTAASLAAGSCTTCPAGYACPFKHEPPRPCALGTYSLGGATQCTTCPAGSSCAATSSAPVECAAGTFSYAGATTCFSCSAGYVCDSPGSTSPTPLSGRCPVHAYCPAGATESITCPLGYYGVLPDGGGGSFYEACAICPAGMKCVDDAGDVQWPVPCGDDEFCPSGVTDASATTCPAGATYALADNADYPAHTASQCVMCAPGLDCSSGTGVACPQGYYCPHGSEGYVSGFPTPCPMGTYGDNTGYILASECIDCPVGHYCPPAATSATECPVGRYNNLTGQGSPTNCLLCPAGRACPNTGIEDPYDGSTTSACSAGYYCPPGTVNATEYACPPGTYSASTALGRLEGCTICPEGSACPHASSAPAACTAGHYCPGQPAAPGTLTLGDDYEGMFTILANQFPCPAGTYSPLTNLTAADECTECPAGSFCRGGEDDISGACVAGNYCPAGTGNGTALPCPAGRYGTLTNLTDSNECTLCDVGHYCPQYNGVGDTAPTACPAGTYRATTGADSIDDCLPCPGGFYCADAGTSDPPACGIGNYSDDGWTACAECVAGHYCPEQNTSLTEMQDTYECDAGLFCPDGSTAAPVIGVDNCPLGYYCVAGTDRLVACPPGRYANETRTESLADCHVCDAGSYCLEGAINASALCDAGFYCPAGSTGAQSEPCPAGRYANVSGTERADDCPTCPAGFYCGPGTPSPLVCPRGYYCPAGSATPTFCPIGTFSNDTQLTADDDCTPCTGGFFCDNSGLTAPTGECDAGFFCTLGAVTSAPEDGVTGDRCETGGYCPIGSNATVLCPAGTFNDAIGGTSESDCTECDVGRYCEGEGNTVSTGPCDAGYYCDGGAPNATQHASDPGYFSPAGATSQTLCAPGSYNNESAQSSCRPCPPGALCPRQGVIDPDPCPLGHYCPENSSVPVRCPLGRFNNASDGSDLDSCLVCTPGSYCSVIAGEAVTGACHIGYYCTGGSDWPAPGGPFAPDERGDGTGDRCPVGHYCPEGSEAPIACPVGTFRSAAAASSDSECLPCTGGSYCGTAGLNTPTATCDAGFFCPGSADANVSAPADGACPAGSFCPAGAIAATVCARGRYQALSESADCDTCPAGAVCGLATVTPADCPAGRYCPAGTWDVAPLACPPGRFSNATDGTERASCTECPAGEYCGESALTEPSGECAAGFYCEAGSQNAFGMPASDDDEYAWTTVPCPIGHYCPAGSDAPVPCPAGRFSNATQGASLAACIECPAGQACTVDALAAPDALCDAGFFCTTAAETATPTDGVTGDECPVGHACPAGSVDAVACDPGRYAADVRAAACDECPTGHACERGTSTPDECAAGTTCVAGTVHAVNCTSGTYNDSPGQSSCTACPSGSYCEGRGLTDVSGDCAAGYVCLGSSVTDTPQEADASTGYRCAAGTYCPAGSTEPVDCDAGAYCDDEALATVAGECWAQYYCSGGAVVPNPFFDMDADTGDICPAGHYCNASTSTPYECPTGRFSPSTGNPSADYCLPCTMGMYCATSGLDSPTGACTAGYYCEFGESSPTATPCPVGTFCEEGAHEPTPCAAGTYQPLTAQSSCLECPLGSYCGGIDAASLEMGLPIDAPSDCPPGSYCPRGTRYATEFLCPSGTFGNVTGLTSENGCMECPPRQYCEEPGSTAPSGDCLPGFYCVGRAAVPDPMDGVTGDECPAGHYCEEGSALPTPCPSGSYHTATRAQSVQRCQPCPPGVYCTGVVLNVTFPCSGGFVCVNGSQTPTPASLDEGGFPCDPGFYCPAGTVVMQPCEPGTLQPLGTKAECAACPEGSYCPEYEMQVGIDCPVGHYCPTGSAQPVPCDPGTYAADEGSGRACPSCPATQYCAGYGLTTPTGNCSAGHICVGGSAVPAPNVFDYSDLVPVNGNCPRGYYCPSGAAEPTPCPVGRFRETVRAQSADECTVCPVGSFCNATALEEPSDLCPAGRFCELGTVDPLARDDLRCPPAHRCPVGSAVPVVCGPGLYQDEEARDECKVCPAGSYCDGEDATPITCPVGAYCERRVSLPTACPAGTFGNSTAYESVDECLPCPASVYCMDGHIDGECQPGHYCVERSSTPFPYRATYRNGTGFVFEVGDECPTGHYCPAGSEEPTACPEGTYQPNVRATHDRDCRPCPAGRTCGTATTTPSACPRGYYCPLFSDDAGNGTVPCPPVHTNTSANVTFGDGSSGATQHDREPPIDGDDCGTCPVGLAWQGNRCARSYEDTVIGPVPCPLGTYSSSVNLEHREDCTLCPPGWLCNFVGLTSAATLPCELGEVCADPCPLGEYCPGGNIDAGEPCPAGTYRDLLGAAGDDDCFTCPAGYYCPTGSIDPIVCPTLHYCVEGSERPRRCEFGDWCDTGFVAARPCQNPAYYNATDGPVGGYYCPGTTTEPADWAIDVPDEVPWPFDTVFPHPGTHTPLPCGDGYYCVLGTHEEEPCPPGRFQNVSAVTSEDRATLETGCEYCGPGAYQDGSNLTACSPCAAGFLCDSGTSARPCANETLYTSDPVGLAACVAAEGGQLCPRGHYCPEGTMEPVPCPQGTYNARYGRSSVVDCLECEAGSFQNKYGQSGCVSCGSVATSGRGSRSCECLGNHRAFQETDRQCLCLPKYEHITESFQRSDPDESSDEDCQPIIYDLCADGSTRLADGSCATGNAVCVTRCPSGFGVLQSSGLCDCYTANGTVVNENTVCGLRCRERQRYVSLEMELNDNNEVLSRQLVVTDPVTGAITRYGMDQYLDSATCDGVCKLELLSMSAVGTEGLYDASNAYLDDFVQSDGLTNSGAARRRRLLEESGGMRSLLQSSAEVLTPESTIENPVVCLDLGTGLVWDLRRDIVEGDNGTLTQQHYPIYLKDALYNTNPLFDYGPFRELADEIAAANALDPPRTVDQFVFVFNEAGVYVFGDNANEERLTVLAVMGDGQTCPDGARVVPLTQANLVKFGVLRDSSITVEPDWGLIAVMVFGCVALMLAAVLGMYTFRKKKWVRALQHSRVRYRKRNLRRNFDSFASKGAASRFLDRVAYAQQHGLVLDGEAGDDDMDAAMDVEALRSEFFDYESQVHLDGFDSKTFYEKLEEQTKRVLTHLRTQNEASRKLYDKICVETEEIKDMLANKLEAQELARLKALDKAERGLNPDNVRNAQALFEEEVVNEQKHTGGVSDECRQAHRVMQEAEAARMRYVTEPTFAGFSAMRDLAARMEDMIEAGKGRRTNESGRRDGVAERMRDLVGDTFTDFLFSNRGNEFAAEDTFWEHFDDYGKAFAQFIRDAQEINDSLNTGSSGPAMGRRRSLFSAGGRRQSAANIQAIAHPDLPGRIRDLDEQSGEKVAKYVEDVKRLRRPYNRAIDRQKIINVEARSLLDDMLADAIEAQRQKRAGEQEQDMHTKLREKVSDMISSAFDSAGIAKKAELEAAEKKADLIAGAGAMLRKARKRVDADLRIKRAMGRINQAMDRMDDVDDDDDGRGVDDILAEHERDMKQSERMMNADLQRQKKILADKMAARRRRRKMQQQEEWQRMTESVEDDGAAELDALNRQFDTELQDMRTSHETELKNVLAQGAGTMSPMDMEAIKSQYTKNLARLTSEIEADRLRQQLEVKRRVAERRRRQQILTSMKQRSEVEADMHRDTESMAQLLAKHEKDVRLNNPDMADECERQRQSAQVKMAEGKRTRLKAFELEKSELQGKLASKATAEKEKLDQEFLDRGREGMVGLRKRVETLLEKTENSVRSNDDVRLLLDAHDEEWNTLREQMDIERRRQMRAIQEKFDRRRQRRREGQMGRATALCELHRNDVFSDPSLHTVIERHVDEQGAIDADAADAETFAVSQLARRQESERRILLDEMRTQHRVELEAEKASGGASGKNLDRRIHALIAKHEAALAEADRKVRFEHERQRRALAAKLDEKRKGQLGAVKERQAKELREWLANRRVSEASSSSGGDKDDPRESDRDVDGVVVAYAEEVITEEVQALAQQRENERQTLTSLDEDKVDKERRLFERHTKEVDQLAGDNEQLSADPPAIEILKQHTVDQVELHSRVSAERARAQRTLEQKQKLAADEAMEELLERQFEKEMGSQEADRKRLAEVLAEYDEDVEQAKSSAASEFQRQRQQIEKRILERRQERQRRHRENERALRDEVSKAMEDQMDDLRIEQTERLNEEINNRNDDLAAILDEQQHLSAKERERLISKHANETAAMKQRLEHEFEEEQLRILAELEAERERRLIDLQEEHADETALELEAEESDMAELNQIMTTYQEESKKASQNRVLEMMRQKQQIAEKIAERRKDHTQRHSQEMAALESELQADDDAGRDDLQGDLETRRRADLEAADRDKDSKLAGARNQRERDRIMQEHEEATARIADSHDKEKERQLAELRKRQQAMRAKRTQQLRRRQMEEMTKDLERDEQALAHAAASAASSPDKSPSGSDGAGDSEPGTPTRSPKIDSTAATSAKLDVSSVRKLHDAAEEMSNTIDDLKAKHAADLELLRQQQEEEQAELADELERQYEAELNALRNKVEDEVGRRLAEAEERKERAVAAENTAKLSSSEQKRILEQHEKELNDIQQAMGTEKERQQADLAARLEERRARRLAALKRRQDEDVQRREMSNMQDAHEAERRIAAQAEREVLENCAAKAAMEQHDEDGEGDEMADEKDDYVEMIELVMQKRQLRETEQLAEKHEMEKTVRITEEVNKLQSVHDAEVRELQVKQDAEYAKIATDSARNLLRIEHRGAMEALQAKHDDEMRERTDDAIAELGLKHANERLDLRKRHVEEVMNATKRMLQSTAAESDDENDDLIAAQQELQQFKARMNEERDRNMTRLKEDRQKFLADQQRLLQDEQKRLESETREESARAQAAVQKLRRQREHERKRIEEKKALHEQALRKRGASEVQRDQILRAHEDDIRQYDTAIDAERDRQKQMLEAKKKQMLERRKAQLRDQHREREARRMTQEEADRQQAADDKEQDQKNRNERRALAARRRQKDAQSDGLQTEQEWFDLLLRSPMFVKLKDLESTLVADVTPAAPADSAADDDDADEARSRSPSPSAGDGASGAAAALPDGAQNAAIVPYVDEYDARHKVPHSGTTPVSVDASKLSTPNFVVYKFGLFVMDLLVLHAQHETQTLLVAKSLPEALYHGNAFAESVYYDSAARTIFIAESRLRTVGHFVVSLVHAMSHIKVGNMNDDVSPTFLREFYRSLHVIGEELFFSRSHRTRKVVRAFPTAISIHEMFQKLPSEKERGKFVSDYLLDVRTVGPAARRAEKRQALEVRVTEELKKLRDRAQQARLRSNLMDLEDMYSETRKRQAVQPLLINKRLQELSFRKSATAMSGGSASPLPGTMPASTGDAARGRSTFESELLRKIAALEEDSDKLTKESVDVARQLATAQNSVRSMEAEVNRQNEELARRFNADLQASIDENMVKLHRARDAVSALTMRKPGLEERVNTVHRQLQDAKRDLQRYRRATEDGKQKMERDRDQMLNFRPSTSGSTSGNSGTE